MKYIDEFRDGALAQRIAAAIAAEADTGRGYNLMEFCGGHTHAISRYGVADLLPAPVRMIHGPGCPVCVLPIGRVDLAIRLALDERVIVATYGDCLRVPGVGQPVAAQGQGARRRRADDLFAGRRAADRPGASRARSRVLRDRLRDDDAAHRARHQGSGAPRPDELQRPVQPRADAGGDHQHPRVARSAPPRHAAARRLHRPGPRVDGDRQPAVRVLRRGIRQARGHRRLRAARCHAGDPDAGAPDQRGPRRGRERIHPRRHARRQPEGAGAGVRGVRAARARSSGAASARCHTAPCASARPSPPSTPSAASASRPDRSPTTRPANAAPSCAASSTRATARSSAPSARRKTRSARAWSPPRERAPRTTATGGFARLRSSRRRHERRPAGLRAPARHPARPRRHVARLGRPGHGAARRAALCRCLRQRVAGPAQRPGAPAPTRGPHRHVDRLSRRFAAVLSRRRHRLPVGARHDQRRRDVGSAAAVAGGRLHPRGRLCPG